MLVALADLAADLAAVQKIMHQAVKSKEQRVNDLIESLGGFHGKMLRPSLVLLIARALGEVSEQHHRIGAALEMIHTATLVHDDLIDDGNMRRGATTAHVKFGNSTAVLLGDFYYTRAFDLIADCGDSWLTKTLTSTTNVICEGELHQMCAQRDASLEEDEYYRIIYAKTAVLCETACRLGAVAGSEAEREAAALYGKHCGMAFQIVDDCLDLSGDPEKVGKTLATDIERGRLTLPFLCLLAQTPEAEREALAQRLVSVDNEDELQQVKQLVVSGGGVAGAMAIAKEHVDTAVAQLEVLPDSAVRSQLAELAQFIVVRDH